MLNIFLLLEELIEFYRQWGKRFCFIYYQLILFIRLNKYSLIKQDFNELVKN